jgi:fructose-1-phosphate kinase PfkB-like protein
VAGAKELAGRGNGIVVISLGAQGAVCVRGERVWHVTAPPVERLSTVGSGDSMVATAMTYGTALGTTEDIAALLPRVEITELS